MKKKILSIMLCLLMVVSMVTVASAQETLPKIPTEKKEIIITSETQGYCFDTYIKSGTNLRVENCERYEYNGSEWVYVETFETISFGTAFTVRYDSTGYLSIENPVKFFAPVGSGDVMQYLDNLQEQINVSTVVEVLVFVAVAIVGLAFMWWGVRKTARVIMSAFRKGKINL